MKYLHLLSTVFSFFFLTLKFNSRVVIFGSVDIIINWAFEGQGNLFIEKRLQNGVAAMWFYNQKSRESIKGISIRRNAQSFDIYYFFLFCLLLFKYSSVLSIDWNVLVFYNFECMNLVFLIITTRNSIHVVLMRRG